MQPALEDTFDAMPISTQSLKIVKMSQVISLQEADHLLEEVVKRAQSDLAFRQLCLSEPSAAIQKLTDKELPAGYALRFVENQGADLTVVLPDLIDANAELSDEDLEQVAGGKVSRSAWLPT